MGLLRGPLGCYRIFVASLDEVAVIALRMAATTGHKQTGHKLKLIHKGFGTFSILCFILPLPLGEMIKTRNVRLEEDTAANSCIKL